MSDIKKLKEEDADIIRGLNAKADLAEKEGRPFTDEEMADQARDIARSEEIKKEIASQELINKTRALSGYSSPNATVQEPIVRGDRKRKEELAFRGWIASMNNAEDLIRSDMRQAAYDLGVDLTKPQFVFRQQSVGVTTEGGLTTNTQYAGLETILKRYSGILNHCDYKTVANGNPGFWSTIDDTANAAAHNDELVAASNVDVVVGKVDYAFDKFSSAVFPISNELITDSNEDWNSIVNECLGKRIGRKLNLHSTTGNLTNNKGFAVETTTQGGATCASPTAVTVAELEGLYRSIDPEYRDNPTSIWLMNDATASKICMLEDDNGQPYFRRSYADGGMLTIFGRPVVIANNMPAATAGLKPIIFGDASSFSARMVGTPTVVALRELYAKEDATGYVSHVRFTSRSRNPTAMKYLLMAAS